MSLQQRMFDLRQAAGKACRMRCTRKRYSWDVDVDFQSEVAVVWSCFQTEEHFERYSGMDVFEDAFRGHEVISPDRVCLDELMQRSYPTLHEFLTATPTLNGKRRKVATMNVVYEDGQCKLGLRERDRELSLWVSAPTMAEALRALEDALGERPVRWRKVNGDYKSRGRQ